MFEGRRTKIPDKGGKRPKEKNNATIDGGEETEKKKGSTRASTPGLRGRWEGKKGGKKNKSRNLTL